jgi:hypothetical protein
VKQSPVVFHVSVAENKTSGSICPCLVLDEKSFIVTPRPVLLAIDLLWVTLVCAVMRLSRFMGLSK